MTLKINQILSFPEFYSLASSTKLPIKTSYKFARLANEVEKNVEFYQTSFRAILNEYGQKDDEGNLVPTEDGQGVKIQEGKIAECNAKVAELHDLDIELPDIRFTLDELENCLVTPQQMIQFLPFIDEE